MARRAVDFLIIAARVATGYPKAPDSGKAKTRDEFMKELALRLFELDHRIQVTIRNIETLHKLKGRMDNCTWLNMMIPLVESLKWSKKSHRECELLLRRIVLEPKNLSLLAVPVP